MFRKILIANRGEIACRVMAACRQLKIRTVAVYSEADANALYVRLADQAVKIGPPENARSYLNMPQILSTADLTGVEAIHPGYGYLAESASFAEIVAAHKLTFIGPPAEVLRLAGDKAACRRRMLEAGVPVIPGSEECVPSPAEARRLAREIGYPVRLKAAMGGGGRGIRVVHNDEEMGPAFDNAQREAQTAFGDPAVYLEKSLSGVRHIEVQILADHHGSIVHLGERDCSLQHRNQKLVEEAPAPGLEGSVRRRLGEAAIKAAEAVGYRNAGTVEFLYDGKRRFYFLEMNARIQVEHPVTEMLTGVDIVQEQLRIAAGERLSVQQGRIWAHGHAIECRILAADSENGFTPCPGKITAWVPPCGPGIRVDSGVTTGDEVPPYYDPMIAKVICWAPTRPEAIARMEAALRGMIVEGVRTTIPVHLRILGNRFFRDAELDTHFLLHRL